jgi:hypothetical protein
VGISIDRIEDELTWSMIVIMEGESCSEKLNTNNEIDSKCKQERNLD